MAPAALGQTVVAALGSAMLYRANTSDPGIGLSWILEGFNDSAWPAGTYGVGYESSPPGAVNLLRTTVPTNSTSVYSRVRFSLDDVTQAERILFGADYDDGYVVWINGVEVTRSATMTVTSPAWNTPSGPHESSNGVTPNYGSLVDITAAARPALHNGVNVLAIGVWNGTLPSSDLVLVPYLVINPSVPVTRGPYLQSGTPTGMTIRWRTGGATDSRVIFGADPANLDRAAVDPILTAEHVVTLTNLAPATRYYYAVGTSAEILAGGDANHFFTTSPAVGTATPARLWVLGDSGTADASARAVRDAYYALAGGGFTDLVLMLGDNAYTSGTDAEYQAAVFDMYPQILRQTVLWPTLGNHDGITADSATQTGPYYDIFTLPRQGQAGGLASGTEAYYAFDHGNIHFICLDSNETDRSPAGAMLTWLEQDLIANDKDWVVAFWHHPPYSHGSHNSDTETELVEMRRNVVPILEGYGVDLVLTGHSHSYERTFLIDGHYGAGSTFTSAMQKDGGDGRADGQGSYRKPSSGPAPHEGAVYVVAGSSGMISGGSLDYPAMYLSLNTLGSLVIDVDGRRLDVRFIDSTGARRDYFTVVKGPASPPLADFSGEPRQGTAPLAIRFTDRSTNGPDAWAWDFEADGVVDSRVQHPDHTYTTAGLKTVRLTASSVEGADTLERPAYVCVLSADGGADADADGVNDGSDGCPCLPDPGQEDADGDGRGDRCDDDDDGDGVNDTLDCAPLAPGLWEPPAPVGDTLAAAPEGATGLRWDRERGGFTSNVYRGTLEAAGPRAQNAVCFEAEVPQTAVADPETPPPGSAFYYLVAGRNACGESAAGRDHAGAPWSPATPCGPRGRESDGDGRPDLEDNCALSPNPGQQDFDRDTRGDACDDSDGDGAADDIDCARLDPTAQTIPEDVGAVLRIGPGPEAIAWSGAPPAAAYDLYRGSVAPGQRFAYSHACLLPGLAVTQAIDPDVPAPGAFHYYLVGAANVCGKGPIGLDSAGAPIPNPGVCQ